MQALHIHNETDRKQFFRNILALEILDQDTPVVSGNYVTQHVLCCIDYVGQDALIDMVDQMLLSARLPSHGVDPFIIEMRWYPFLTWMPQRLFVFLWIGSVIF